MFNYQIIIEYLGTDYIGWQIQKKGSSIQLIVQKALTKVLNSKIKIVLITNSKRHFLILTLQ